MSNILIVANRPSPNTVRLQQAVFDGCRELGFESRQIRTKAALDADASDVIWSNGIIIGTTENFGYMSGLIKDFFERIYYPCLEQTQGKSAALYVKGGLDGQGARSSVEKILIGLKWKLIQPPLVLKGEFEDNFTVKCKELGMTMAAGLESGIF